MVESRVYKIESFVRELVNKIMLEAMELVDSNTEETASLSCQLPLNCAYIDSRQPIIRKNRSLSSRGARQGNERMKKSFPCEGNLDDATNTSILRRSAVLSLNPRSLEDNSIFNVDQRASEEIRKIVQSLQGMQIGDVYSVQPVVEISSLERQVKRAVQEMSRSNEAPPAEGQGDFHDKSFEEDNIVIEEIEYDVKDSPPSSFEMPETIVTIPEVVNQQTCQIPQEVSKLRSTCFLHRMIKELENAEASHENVLASSASISGISQERIAVWEESEEKFIRTIEGSKCEDEGEFVETPLIIEVPPIISPIDNAPAGCIVSVEIEELDSSTPAPLSPSTLNIQKTLESTQQEEKSKTKKTITAKLRKFFRSAFKRGKDC